jgi:hypothetical protein
MEARRYVIGCLWIRILRNCFRRLLRSVERIGRQEGMEMGLGITRVRVRRRRRRLRVVLRVEEEECGVRC